MVESKKRSKKNILRNKNKKSLKNKEKKYRKKRLSGGLMESQVSDFNDNMHSRRFNCRQPLWEASCI